MCVFVRQQTCRVVLTKQFRIATSAIGKQRSLTNESKTENTEFPVHVRLVGVSCDTLIQTTRPSAEFFMQKKSVKYVNISF